MNILKGHKARIRALAFSPDGRLLASAGNGRRIRLWDVATGEPRGVLSSPSRFVYDLAFSPDGGVLASGGFDGAVRLWDVAGARPITALDEQPVRIASVQFSGRELLAASSLPYTDLDHTPCRALVWDADTGRESAALRLDWPHAIFQAQFLPGGREVALGLNGGPFLIWDRAAAPRAAFGPSTPEPAGVREVRWAEAVPDFPDLREAGLVRLDVSPDGRTLAAASGNHVLFFDLAAGGSLRAVVKQRLIVRSVAFSPDGAHLATCGYDGFVRLLDPADGSEEAAYHWDVGEINRVAFAPGGMTAAAAGETGIMLWDVQEGL